MTSDPEREIRRALSERAAGVTDDRLRFANGPRALSPDRRSRWATSAPFLAAACVAVIAVGIAVALVTGRGADPDLANRHGQPTTLHDVGQPAPGGQDSNPPSRRSGDQTASAIDAGFPPAEPDAAAECAGSGTVEAFDTGFNLAAVEVGVEGERACFFDGVQWWAADLSAAPIRTAQVTGVGRFVSQVASAPVTSGRQLWVITDPEVRHLTVSYSDGYAGKSGAWEILGPDSKVPVARFFLFRVPATGSATVTVPGLSDAPVATVGAVSTR